MVFIPSLQDLSQSSGIIPVGFLESVYEGLMDNALVGLGRTVVFHLPPLISQDTTTQSQPQASQYNPYFGGVVAPRTNTRITGTQITPQDVAYTAHIRVNPIGRNDLNGIGDLKDNEIMITVGIEALDHVKRAISFTVEGRNYSIGETRPVGFSKRKYLMIKGEEINEAGSPSPDGSVG